MPRVTRHPSLHAGSQPDVAQQEQVEEQPCHAVTLIKRPDEARQPANGLRSTRALRRDEATPQHDERLSAERLRLHPSDQCGIRPEHALHPVGRLTQRVDASGWQIGHAEAQSKYPSGRPRGERADGIAHRNDDPQHGHEHLQHPPHGAICKARQALHPFVRRPRALPLARDTRGIEMLTEVGSIGQLTDRLPTVQHGRAPRQRTHEPLGQERLPGRCHRAIETAEERLLAEDIQVEREGVRGVGVLPSPIERAEIVIDRPPFGLVEAHQLCGEILPRRQSVVVNHQRHERHYACHRDARQHGPPRAASDPHGHQGSHHDQQAERAGMVDLSLQRLECSSMLRDTFVVKADQCLHRQSSATRRRPVGSMVIRWRL